MKIAFIWYWDKASQVYDNWRDGLRSAVELIGKKHEVTWFLDKKLPTEKFDFYLIWDDSNTQAVDLLPEGRKGLCLTTSPTNIDNLRKFDVVYCESDPVYEEVRRNGIKAIKAFGTDTDFFKPSQDVKKDIEYFYPATFSPWKLQRDIAYLGKKLTCVGTLQPDGTPDFTKCVENGVNIKQGYFPVEYIKDCYNRSQKVIIPAIHGSERTVLEAMSCGIKPIVTNTSNIKTLSYIKELEESGLNPREFVLKNYSHVKYAEQLLKGIEE